MSFIFGSEVAISPTWVAEFFAQRTEIETRRYFFFKISSHLFIGLVVKTEMPIG